LAAGIEDRSTLPRLYLRRFDVCVFFDDAGWSKGHLLD
jgi:hypothetical protein